MYYFAFGFSKFIYSSMDLSLFLIKTYFNKNKMDRQFPARISTQKYTQIKSNKLGQYEVNEATLHAHKLNRIWNSSNFW